MDTNRNGIFELFALEPGQVWMTTYSGRYFVAAVNLDQSTVTEIQVFPDETVGISLPTMSQFIEAQVLPADTASAYAMIAVVDNLDMLLDSVDGSTAPTDVTAWAARSAPSSPTLNSPARAIISA